MFSFFKKKAGKSGYQIPEGSKNISLDEIDTSYWKLDNKEWMTKRKAKWPQIEAMLGCHKAKSKAISIIKAYYLSGKMPNWSALKAWDGYGRHVDIFVFLWLHPSWDERLLKELRDLYIYSDLIVRDDLARGFWFLYSTQNLGIATVSSEGKVDFPNLEGRGELLFRVMMGEPIQMTYEIIGASDLPKGRSYQKEYQLPGLDLGSMFMAGVWLSHSKMLPIHHDFLYQYDQPLEWWYQCCRHNDEYFTKPKKMKEIPSLEKMLYRFHHFNTQKEGDTCRTRFVHKIRKILDEREFISEFKQMWEDVKSGKIVVDNPWER